MAAQMAEDLERVDFPSLGTAAMFTSYDEQNKGNDIDKEGIAQQSAQGNIGL